jgi:hypothetical protein
MNLIIPSTTKQFLRIALALFELAIGAIVTFILIEGPAQAYTDPGSGAVLWQLLFASIVSIGFHFRKLRLWLTNWRSRR